MSENEKMSGVIRRLRMERGWTQEELGERVGVSAQAVSKWETGQSLPDISQLPLLAKAFGVTTDLLFGLEEEPEPDFPQGDAWCTEPEEAWQLWQEMGRKLEGCINVASCVQTYLFQGYLLCQPDSLVYHPEHAKEVRDELLAFAEKYAKKKKPSDRISDFSFDSIVTNLNALAGNEEKALGMLRGAPVLPHELASFRRAEVYRLLGKRREEYIELENSAGLLRSLLLPVLYRLAESALALGRKDEAMHIVEFALGFLRFLSGTEKADVLFSQDGNSFLQLEARVLLARGKREEALARLGQMVEEKLESLAPGYRLAVNTPLLRAVQISDDGRNEKSHRYALRQLLHSLDHPELEALREEPGFRALRERVEAQTKEG